MKKNNEIDKLFASFLLAYTFFIGIQIIKHYQKSFDLVIYIIIAAIFFIGFVFFASLALLILRKIKNSSVFLFLILLISVVTANSMYYIFSNVILKPELKPGWVQAILGISTISLTVLAILFQNSRDKERTLEQEDNERIKKMEQEKGFNERIISIYRANFLCCRLIMADILNHHKIELNVKQDNVPKLCEISALDSVDFFSLHYSGKDERAAMNKIYNEERDIIKVFMEKSFFRILGTEWHNLKNTLVILESIHWKDYPLSKKYDIYSLAYDYINNVRVFVEAKEKEAFIFIKQNIIDISKDISLVSSLELACYLSKNFSVKMLQTIILLAQSLDTLEEAFATVQYN